MDYIEDSMKLINSLIEKKCIEIVLREQNIQHNHPPVRFVVEGCEYCKLYGNCFKKSDISDSM